MDKMDEAEDRIVWQNFTRHLNDRRVVLISYEYAKSLKQLKSDLWREVARTAFFSDRNGEFEICEFDRGGRDDADRTDNAARRGFPNPNSVEDQRVIRDLQASMDYLASRLANNVEITVVREQEEEIILI